MQRWPVQRVTISQGQDMNSVRWETTQPKEDYMLCGPIYVVVQKTLEKTQIIITYPQTHLRITYLCKTAWHKSSIIGIEYRTEKYLLHAPIEICLKVFNFISDFIRYWTAGMKGCGNFRLVIEFKKWINCESKQYEINTYPKTRKWVTKSMKWFKFGLRVAQVKNVHNRMILNYKVCKQCQKNHYHAKECESKIK